MLWKQQETLQLNDSYFNPRNHLNYIFELINCIVIKTSLSIFKL